MADLLELKRKIDILWKLADICPKCEANRRVICCVGYGSYCPVCDVSKTPIETKVAPKPVEESPVDIGCLYDP